MLDKFRAGEVDAIALGKESLFDPIGTSSDGKQIRLADFWPTDAEMIAA